MQLMLRLNLNMQKDNIWLPYFSIDSQSRPRWFFFKKDIINTFWKWAFKKQGAPLSLRGTFFRVMGRLRVSKVKPSSDVCGSLVGNLGTVCTLCLGRRRGIDFIGSALTCKRVCNFEVWNCMLITESFTLSNKLRCKFRLQIRKMQLRNTAVATGFSGGVIWPFSC